jgi:N-acetylmuramoyl-L-alanine amidase
MRLISTVLLLVTLQGASQSTIGGSYLSRSVGKLTMLGSGLGEDRLGGAKFGYIDTSVLLQIVDSTKDMYLVRLSKSHTAYINKSDLKSDTSTKLRPFYLTNSWSVKGDEQYDYVNISLDEKLPYKSWMEINPSKIYLDIYGVQSNTNWITQLRSVKEITNVYFNQLEDDVVRVCIELKHKQNWGYSINYNNKILSVRVRRQPPVLKVNKMIIAVDAGHGGSNTGASGITTKVLEKNFTIRFANELQKYLTRKGAAIIMTRTSDTNVNNVDRVLMLQDAMPDLLISLHLNSSGNTNVKGVSTYYKHIGFRLLTTSILHRMLQLNLNEFGNIGSFNFTLNAPTDFPNSLVEIAFLSNPEDEKKILNPRFHKAVAKKIHRGVKDWLKTVRKS